MSNNISSHSKDIPVTRIIITADPAAGSNTIIGVPVSNLIELVSLSFTLVTDANAGNRIVSITMQDAGDTWVIGSSSFEHTASKTFTYICNQNAFFNIATSAGFLMCTLPLARFLTNIHILNIIVDDIQVGDQISDIRAIFNAWAG